MDWLVDELRLGYLVALTAIVFACAVRFARRTVGGDWVETLLDALLLTFVIQYISVGLPGAFGVLSVWSIAVTAVLACGVLGALAREPVEPRAPTVEGGWRWLAIGLAIFVVCYAAVLVWEQRRLPPVANDTLTYHLPAAVQWLQTGRLGLYETWFFNPANTYSPLAGSVLIAWWLAPLSNDVLARFVQAPALLLLFVALVQIVRAFGVSTAVAALIAAGAVASRPFISQTILAKDDLLLAAFFAALVAGLTRIKLADPLGPWRVGLALGMLLATKYTALLALPLLVLAIDAPLRAGWKPRQWLVALLCAAALAAPWYIRNIVLTGNPLFPMHLPGFEGLFATRPSPDLGSLDTLTRTFITGYYSTTWPAGIMLMLLWLGAAVVSSKNIMRNPLVRISLLGPPLGIVIFLLASPYPEIRFTYPCLLLMFACAGIVAYRLRSTAGGMILGSVVLVAGAGTGFVPRGLLAVLPTALVAAAVGTLIAWGIARLDERRRERAILVGLLGAVLLSASLLYVYYRAFLRRAEVGYADTTVPSWQQEVYGYGVLAEAWGFVRSELPINATVAYTNTHFTYPLYGFDLMRPVVYAPTRPGIARLYDLPFIGERFSGEQIVPAVSAALTDEPDQRVWLDALQLSGARYLFIVKHPYGTVESPPEFAMAARLPERFVNVFENSAAVVYRIED